MHNNIIKQGKVGCNWLLCKISDLFVIDAYLHESVVKHLVVLVYLGLYIFIIPW